MAMRALLISAAVVSSAIAVKLSLPSISNFAADDVPAIWSDLLSWLKPPYLYVVINGIIISIAASSRFYNHHEETQSPPLVNPSDAPSPSDLPSESILQSFAVSELPAAIYEEPPVAYESEIPVLDVETVPTNDLEASRIADEDEDEIEISRSPVNTPRITNSPPSPEKFESDFIFPAKEKPLVTSRFAHQRKPMKPSTEGIKSLRVAKPKKHETLESTWKMITDGRHMPLTRHLHHHLAAAAAEMSDGSSNHPTLNHRLPADPSPRNLTPASAGRLRKEGSLGQDELNRRVEAFIKKFNDEMRLQREESLKRYKVMMNRGAH